MGKSKRLIIVVNIMLLIILVVGATYAAYNYTFIGSRNLIETETVSVEFLESSSEIISINNAIPISDDVGKNLNDKFSFAVTSKMSRDANIEYSLKIEKLDPPSGYTNLNDNQVKVYLTDYDDNVLVGPVKISDLSNYVLYTKENIHNTSTPKIQNKYKLRVWIDEQVDSSSWDENTKLEYKFKIGIDSKEVATEQLSVNVVVKNGTVNGEAEQKVNVGENASFNLVPNTEGLKTSVRCDNTDSYTFTNNVLTVSNVTKNTVCTVDYIDGMTTLYEDGTLIINENTTSRSANIEKHGSVTKEYEAMSEDNPYVFNSSSDVLWYNERSSIKQVEIGSRISPISTAYWFYDLQNMTTGDFTKLNTSSVTDMHGMFAGAAYDSSTFKLIGLDNWDISKVTNMNNMFNYAGFYVTTFDIGDLSEWDTSSVTDMGGMFNFAVNKGTTFNIGDLSGWNTSRVINMSNMFRSAGKNANWALDCSRWNVNKVTSYSNFNSGVESKVTPPVWVN